MIRVALLCAIMLLGTAAGSNAQLGPYAVVPSLRALDVVFGGENLNMGATAGLQFVSHYLNIGASYSMHSLYMDRIKSDAADATLPFATTAINDSRAIEAGAQLNLFSWDDDQDFSILDRVERRSENLPSGSTLYTTTFYSHIRQFPSRMFIGVRGGYYEWGTPLSSAKKTDPLVSTTGVQLGNNALSQYMDVFTNVRTKSYYAGLAYSYFVYSAGRYQTYFADVFFGAKTEFDPIVLGTNKFVIQGPGSKGFPVREIGYRVGVDVFVEGVSARGEFGVRPGTFGGYLLLSGGIALPQWWW